MDISDSMPSDESMEIHLSHPCITKRIEYIEKLRGDTRVPGRILDVFIDIENVPTTITDYREKERHLESLLKVLRSPDIIDSEFSQLCAFHYLLGSLYINFEKFWGPTKRVITDVINQSKFRNLLLVRLLCHLRETNNYIYNEKKRQNASSDGSRPDHLLHRNLVFQILAQFIDFVETNSKLFMDEFLLFVDKEIRVHPFVEAANMVDLTSNKSEVKIDTNDSNINLVRKHVDTTATHSEETLQKAKKMRCSNKRFKFKPKTPLPQSILEKRKSRETFITSSKIIQSFTNIGNVHREPELKQLILDLLSCRDLSVQRAAFNCLCAYNIEAVTIYKDNVRNMLDMKQIRSELAVFSLDSENSNRILSIHRQQFIPIVQRILYGRMISQVGKKTSGSDKADKRKDFLMRFIAGCSEEEIYDFFGILFGPLIKYLSVDYWELESCLSSDLNIRKFIPINKLQAMLNTIKSFLKFVGNLKQSLLPHCFKLINIIGYNISKALENRELVDTITHKNADAMKNVRRSCVATLIYFFKDFEYYPFSQEEIDFTFKLFLWPSSQSFIDRNYASVTPILRLIEVFCHSRVYHKLLFKRNKNNPEEHLLEHLISLYCDDKTDRLVTKSISDMIAAILNAHISEEADSGQSTNEPPQLNDEDSRIPEYFESTLKIPEDGFPENHRMLFRYIPHIFRHLSSVCQTFIEKKDTNFRFEKSELLILSSLSNYLKESYLCVLATKLLITTLDKLKNHELIIKTLKTAQDLMRQTSGPIDSSIVDYLAKNLYYQHNPEQRRELCNLLEILSGIDANLQVVCTVIKNMNSQSEDLIGSPDLGKWNEGFHITFDYLDKLDAAMVNDFEIVRNPINLLVHQVGFIVNSVDKYEFSVRDNCLIFYERLSDKLKLIDRQKNMKFLDDIIGEVILNKFIKKGLRETNDMIKHLHLGIVRVMAMNCHEQNNILREFHLFCNANQDIDFWLNLKHVQVHNRSKALARLVNDENLRKVNPKTLSSYFMPLASGFLFNKNYKSMASLVENSIKLIGFICRNLNWNTYESTLSYYLDLLTSANATYQRTNIKLITEILRNFNFDLTSCEEAIKDKAEDERLEKRMQKRLRQLGQELDENSPIVVQQKRLSPSTAKMIYLSMTKKLIPRLNSCLHEMTRVEFEHDKNMSEYKPEIDEIKRIPVSFAIVQLLNLLPCKYILFRDQLPALFLKLASFLKSKNEQTRKAARATLIRIMKFVGPMYIPDLLRIMRQNLDKGFHIHVLNYTINSVLENSSLVYGDLDVPCRELLDLCLQEIFGKPSEDKDIAKVIAKTPEAKKTKGYDTLFIMANYISEEKLDNLIQALKNYMKTANDSKVVNKLSVCLQRVFTGLAQNQQFPLDKLLSFLQSTIEESIPSLRVLQKVELPENPKLPIREDRYLITEPKTKQRLKSKINERGNSHMLVENSLKLLLSLFEKNKTKLRSESSLQQQLDGFIRLLATCLKSSSPRCVMRALKCLHFVAQTKIDLPSFKTRCNSIVKKIFILLSLYNGVGMVKGDNYDMISMCFRTLTLLLLKCEHVQLSADQIRALMSYIEQDMNDTSRQATAFKTLYSLILKKYESPELPELLNSVAETLVTSSDENSRLYSIKIWRTYLLNYKLDGDKLQIYLNRFLRQLNYEFIDGRKSVLKMLRAIVEEFPERILRDHFELFFYLLAQSVINDESKEVRDLVSCLISLLIQRLPDKQVFTLNKFILPWSSCDNLELNTLGIKLISIFLEACPDHFNNDKDRVSKVLKIIENSLTVGLPKKVKEEDCPATSEFIIDRLSYHSLRLFKRILDKGIISATENRHIDQLKNIWQIINRHKLNHRHEPVVLTSCMLYMHIITKTNLAGALRSEGSKKDDYIERNSTNIVVSLCDKFIELLDRFDHTNKIYNYVVQSLILLGQMMAHSKSTLEFEEKYADAFENNDILGYLLMLNDVPKDGFIEDKLPYSHSEAKKNGTLMWLSIKVVMQARKEAAKFRMTKSYRRDFVLRWTAAVAQELGPHRIIPYAFLFMTTPARELTDKGKNKLSNDSTRHDISLMSEDLLKFIKSLLGLEFFNKMYAKAQLHYAKRRAERKKTEAVLRVREQTKGVKKKLSQRKNKDTKRRKNKSVKRLADRSEDRDIRRKRVRT